MKAEGKGYQRAKGVLPWKKGDERPEDAIRRLRGDYDKELAAKDAQLAVLREALQRVEDCMYDDEISRVYLSGLVKHALSTTPKVLWSGGGVAWTAGDHLGVDVAKDQGAWFEMRKRPLQRTGRSRVLVVEEERADREYSEEEVAEERAEWEANRLDWEESGYVGRIVDDEK